MNKHNRAPLSHRELCDLLHYDHVSGVFTYRKTTTRGKAGTVAGSQTPGGICIRINGVPYLAHRLAWFYVYGFFPEYGITHLNGDVTDNCIDNLEVKEPKKIVPRRY